MQTQYLSDFAIYLEATGFRPSTRKMAYSCVERFLVWLQPQTPLTVTLKQLKAWHEHLQERPNLRRGGGLSARMIRHYLYSLRLFYNYLEQIGKLKSNPMSVYPMPIVPNSKRNILSLSEIKRLYAACESPGDTAMLHIYYGLGLRRSEGVALLTQDLDLETGLLYVRRGKGGRWRAVPMSERIRKELSEYLATRQNVGQKGFLLSKKGRALSGSNANRRLKTLLEKAGLPTDISLHSLRHSIASHLLQSGLSMEEVRRFLGHNHLETTQIYLHNGLEDLA